MRLLALLSGAVATLFLSGCGASAPDYAEIPASKLPAGTAPTMPPPPPPNGAVASGPAPHYTEAGAAPGKPPAPR